MGKNSMSYGSRSRVCVREDSSLAREDVLGYNLLSARQGRLSHVVCAHPATEEFQGLRDASECCAAYEFLCARVGFGSVCSRIRMSERAGARYKSCDAQLEARGRGRGADGCGAYAVFDPEHLCRENKVRLARLSTLTLC